MRQKSKTNELREFFDSPEYWCGDIGYRPDVNGVGYQDFPVYDVWVDLIMSREPKNVLDIGCAFGFIVKRLNDKGIPAWGVDISKYAVEHKVHPNVILASADDLPFKDNEFDFAVSASTFEHIPEDKTDKVISELNRVASRGIISISYKDHHSMLDDYGDVTHVNMKDELWWRSKIPMQFEMMDISIETMKAYSRGITKLNLGTFGDNLFGGWINIDILPLRTYLHPAIRFMQWDLTKYIPWKDNSVDLIRCSHLIEHLTFEEAKRMLKECNRILKPGGLLRISTPDWNKILKHYDNNDMSYFNAIQPTKYIIAKTEVEKLSRLIFSGDYSHKAIYNYNSLRQFLNEAGFKQIQISSFNHSLSKVMQNETIDRHEIVSLYMEAIK